MTTYPDTPFVDGQVWSPELAYLAFHQSYGDSLNQTYLGNHPGITDAQLSDGASAIKTRVSNVLNPLVITTVSGLTVNVGSGTVSLTDGTLVAIAATNLVMPDNATTYIYVDSTGTLTFGSSIPVICYPIGRVITSGGAITSTLDYRSLAIRRVAPRPYSIKSFGGVNSTDIVCTALTDLSDGLYYCRDFIVPSGVSITVPGYLRIYASRNVQIDGTLTVNPISDGGVSNLYSPDTTAGFRGYNRGSGLGSTGNTYQWGFQNYGSGGVSGEGFCNNAATFLAVPGGGKGGGLVLIEAAGTITGAGTISCKGSNGNGGYTYINGSPTNTTPGYFEPTTSASIEGGAGGSGGFISLSSLTGVTFTGTLDVRGGNGGLSMTNITGHFAGGGCPGAGGVIVITSPSYNVSGATLQVAGGSFGTTQQLVTGATVSGGVYTLPTANILSLYNGRAGASFVSTGGYWVTTTSGSNKIATPVAASAGSTILRAYVPLG